MKSSQLAAHEIYDDVQEHDGKAMLPEHMAEIIEKHFVNEHAALEEYKEACEKFVGFPHSLPKGWLGKTTGDVGLLNDAYLQEAKAKRTLEQIRNGKAQS